MLTAGTGAVAVMEADAREFADAFAVDRVFTKRGEK